MKPCKLIPTVAVLIGLLFACSLENPWNNPSPGGEAALPPDKISDVARSYGSFAYETLLPVAFDLTVELYESSSVARSLDSLPTEENLVIATLRDSAGLKVFQGSFAENGTLRAVVAVPAAPEDMTLTLEGPGFQSRSVTIPELVRYSEVKRTMALMADGLASKDLLPDHDGDTVPDQYDADPYDPKVTFKNNVPAEGFLTVAYEDLYKVANAGDADYNDFVAEFRVEESYLLERLSSVKITAIARRKWAGYNHAFGIALEFDGAATGVLDYYTSEALEGLHKVSKFAIPDLPGATEEAVIELFQSTKDSIGHATVCTISFDEPYVDPKTFTRAPYDPYLYIWNTGYDVHLIGRQSLPDTPLYDVQNNVPEDTFQDANGFPWALLVPMGWESPAETQYIGEAYPLFDLWRESQGEDVPSWYLYPGGQSSKPGNLPPYPVLAKAPKPEYPVGGSAGMTYQLGIAEVDGRRDPDDPNEDVFFRSSLLPEGWSLDESTGTLTLANVNEECKRIIYFWSEDVHGASTIDEPFKATFRFVGMANQPPVASSAAISGGSAIGATLTASYEYSDPDGDSEGASIFQWYRFDSAAATSGGTPIADATGLSYITTSADSGKWLRFEVTPVDSNGAAGDPALSPPLRVNTWIVIDTFAPNGGYTNDTFLTLVSDTGKVITTDDDGNPDQTNHRGFSRINVTAGLPAGKLYYVKVHKDSPDGGGYYAVRILTYLNNDFSPFPGFMSDPEDVPEKDDDPTVAGPDGEIPANPRDIAIGQTISRAIDPENNPPSVPSERDWYRFEVQ